MTTSHDTRPDLLTSLDAPVGEPLSLLSWPVRSRPGFGEARVESLEFACRGDRVRCTLIMPAGEGPFPLVLVQPDAAEADLLTSLECASGWVSTGCALASIELPLQGTRRSAKLTELLFEAMARARSGESLDEASHLLWYEFTRQAVAELRRTLDIMAALPTIDAQRICFAGFGLAAFPGAIFAAVDDRVRGAVLAGCGGGIAPETIAPELYVGRISPRPVQLINDEAPALPTDVTRAAAEKLHARAADPKEIVWQTAPERAFDAAWTFLSRIVEL